MQMSNQGQNGSSTTPKLTSDQISNLNTKLVGIEMKVSTVKTIAIIAGLVVLLTVIFKLAGRDMWKWVPSLAKKTEGAAPAQA